MALSLVETSEEDSLLATAVFIGSLIDKDKSKESKLIETEGSRFVQDCTLAYEKESYGNLLELFISKLDVLHEKSTNDQDLEGSMNMICHLVPRIPPPGSVAGAQALAASLASSAATRPERRLQALINLYNIVWDSQAKLAVLMHALKFSKISGLADIMLGVVRSHADSWAQDLHLNADDERALYVACADALRACTRKPKTASKESHRLLVKYLVTFEGVGDAEASKGVDVAAQVVTEFLKSPEIFTFDLLENPAVVSLAGSSDPMHKSLHQLLMVYLSGAMTDYKSLASVQPDMFERLGIAPEDALKKMQLLALIGVAHGSNELVMDDIAPVLQVDREEVEDIIVQAVARKLMEARIDQLRGVVTIHRCVSRTFGLAEWQELQKHLRSWQSAVGSVLEISTDERKALQEGVAQLGLITA